MIKVLHLTSTSDFGGAERMVHALARGLDPALLTIHGGSLIGSGELLRRCTSDGIPTVHFEFRFPADPRGIARLIRYIRTHKIQVVQTHGLRADAIARWAARMGGARYILSTIHSVDPWRRWQHVLLDRTTSGFVDQYVAVCEAAKGAAVQREKISPNAVKVIPIGISPAPIPRERRDEVRQAFGLSAENYPTVGILANLREMKGHRYVIEALAQLRQDFPGITVLFAGRDDSNGALQQYAARLGVQDSIRFLGFVKDTPAVLAAIDIFLLPSDWEGLPVSVLEALHAGVPIIATRVGGIPEILRDGVEGVLIEPRSPRAIRDAIVSLTEDFATRARFVRAAERRAVTEFSLERMVRQYDSLYRGLIAPSPENPDPATP